MFLFVYKWNYFQVTVPIESITFSVCLVTPCKCSSAKRTQWIWIQWKIPSCRVYCILCVLFLVFRSSCCCCRLSAVMAGGSFLTSYSHNRRYNGTSTLTLPFVILYSLFASSPHPFRSWTKNVRVHSFRKMFSCIIQNQRPFHSRCVTMKLNTMTMEIVLSQNSEEHPSSTIRAHNSQVNCNGFAPKGRRQIHNGKSKQMICLNWISICIWECWSVLLI